VTRNFEGWNTSRNAIFVIYFEGLQGAASVDDRKIDARFFDRDTSLRELSDSVGQANPKDPPPGNGCRRGAKSESNHVVVNFVYVNKIYQR
jgi:hypothetical protein